MNAWHSTQCCATTDDRLLAMICVFLVLCCRYGGPDWSYLYYLPNYSADDFPGIALRRSAGGILKSAVLPSAWAPATAVQDRLRLSITRWLAHRMPSANKARLSAASDASVVAPQNEISFAHVAVAASSALTGSNPLRKAPHRSTRADPGTDASQNA